MNKELLDCLVCPETHQPLHLAEAGEMARLRQLILEGRVRTAQGVKVVEPLEAALIRQDGRVAYPVRNQLPILLITQAILLEDASDSSRTSQPRQ